MAKYKTRKDWREETRGPRKWKKDLKHSTAGRNRRRPVEDETPYKKLDDPWNYD